MKTSSSSNDLMPKAKPMPLLDKSAKRYAVLSFFVLGLVVCVTSLICILYLPAFVTNQISKRLVLKNNSMLLERWSKPNVPMYFKVWLFDVKNAQEIISKRGTKPVLKEIGPFVFHLKRQKDIVSFAGDNVYYTERKIYHFSPELSCCAINTTVTVPNIPLVAVVDRALSYNLPLVGRFIPRLINRAIQSLREQLFVKKQVRELLFDGYEVDLLKMVSRVGSLVGLPQTNQKFALLKGRNDSWRPEQDGIFAINTGQRDRQQFGRVSSWNSYKQLPFWAAPTCNTINGSDGTLFPPPIKKSEPLYIFNQELCRTVNLVYDRPSDIRAIKALRFVLNPLNFAHTMPSGASPLLRRQPASAAVPLATPSPAQSAARPELRPQASEPLQSVSQRWRARSAPQPIGNQDMTAKQQERLVQAAQESHLNRQSQSRMNPLTCFCDRKTTNLNGANVCEFDGLIDLSKCTKQAQVIFGSMPHFFQSDQRLLKQVVGLEPNASKHTTYLDIEPNTGLVLGGKRRVQLNLIIKHNNEVDGFENISDMMVPVVWFEESALIPEEMARKFRTMYTDRIWLANVVLTTLFLAALSLLAIDMRLLASHYSFCFAIKMKCCKATAASMASGSAGGSLASEALEGAGKRRSRNSAKSAPSAELAKGQLADADYALKRALNANGQLNLPLLSGNLLESKSGLGGPTIGKQYNDTLGFQSQSEQVDSQHQQSADNEPSMTKIAAQYQLPAGAEVSGAISAQLSPSQQSTGSSSTTTLATSHTLSTTID